MRCYRGSSEKDLKSISPTTLIRNHVITPKRYFAGTVLHTDLLTSDSQNQAISCQSKLRTAKLDFQPSINLPQQTPRERLGNPKRL